MNNIQPPYQTPPSQPYVPGAPPAGGAPPPGIDPVTGKPMQVLAVRPIRKKHPAIWIAAAVILVVVIFALAWVITSSGGSNSYLEGIFNQMEGLSGWEASVRVDSSGYGVDGISFYLGESWKGTLVFQSPGRFSLFANSMDGKASYGLRIIEDTLYEWDNFTGAWRNLGPVDEGQKGANPLWDVHLADKLSTTEGDEMVDVEGHMCKVLSFDQEIKESDSFYGQDYEIVYHLAGQIYVENGSDLLVAMDYIVEVEDLGRSHYRYDFYNLGSQTTVDVPSGAIPPAGGG